MTFDPRVRVSYCDFTTHLSTEYKEHDMPQGNDRIADRSKQIGGNHYNKYSIQPWDVIIEYKLDYFEGNALKYLLRRKSNRVEDLEKAAHYLSQAIHNEKQRASNPKE